MPYVMGAVMLLAQLGFVVHVVRTGRPIWWIFLVLALPLVGMLAYFLIEVLPDLQRSGAVERVAKVIDRDRDLKRHAANLDVSDSVQNKVILAREYLATGRHDEAIQLFRSALSGLYKDDPQIMLGLAQAYFAQGKYQASRELLDQLIAANPDFKSPDGHLLYARALEELGEDGLALEEYAVLAPSYPGLEAKGRYGLLLAKHGRAAEAQVLFNEIVAAARRNRKFYRRDQLEWVDVAKRQLAGSA